jgi:hypothetical protein
MSAELKQALIFLVNYAFPESVMIDGKVYVRDEFGVYGVPPQLEHTFKRHGFVSAQAYLDERYKALSAIQAETVSETSTSTVTSTAVLSWVTVSPDPVNTDTDTTAAADPVDTDTDTTAVADPVDADTDTVTAAADPVDTDTDTTAATDPVDTDTDTTTTVADPVAESDTATA